MKTLTENLSNQLSTWYLQNRRPLPWRVHRDPYKIWISEVMLQQTTVQAVIPYYERFLSRFPDVKSLSSAALEDVLESWAGLGYYSRARNLHKASHQLAKFGFPKTAEELIELSGFGPYTSRAVASLAFGQRVGVLDGNVIRVLCRVFGLKLEWWNTKERQTLQGLSDELVQIGEPSIVNQALMELGATVCTPQSPTCNFCPWNQNCVAFDKDWTLKLPLKKPRRSSEVWVWKAQVFKKQGKFAVIENNYAPFLKKQWIFPGSIKMQNEKPKSFDLQHGITHHNIYIQIESAKYSQNLMNKTRSMKWVTPTELKKMNPSSMLQKIIDRL